MAWVSPTNITTWGAIEIANAVYSRVPRAKVKTTTPSVNENEPAVTVNAALVSALAVTLVELVIWLIACASVIATLTGFTPDDCAAANVASQTRCVAA